MTIYLYVKQHNITKLKYFGKTTRDPYSYNGSGKYWKRHISKYGLDISTLYVHQFEDFEECKKFALEFSETNNIVESTEWANLKPENGSDGGANATRPAGGLYGGGGGACDDDTNGAGGAGAVRIIWGSGRSYPSTNTGDL